MSIVRFRLNSATPLRGEAAISQPDSVHAQRLLFAVARKRMHPMNKPMLCKLLLAICVAFLVSCNAYPSVTQGTPIPLPLPTQTDSAFRYDWKNNWLNNATCAPPCWENITPGQTTLQEATGIIKNLPGVEIYGTYRDKVDWGVHGLYSGSASVYGFGPVGDGSNTILNISIYFGDDENISLQDVLRVFDSPSNVQVVDCMHSLCTVNVIYPESGLLLRLELVSTENTVVIDETSELVGLDFFTPGMDNYQMVFYPFRDFAIRKWEGYGTYQE